MGDYLEIGAYPLAKRLVPQPENLFSQTSTERVYIWSESARLMQTLLAHAGQYRTHWS